MTNKTSNTLVFIVFGGYIVYQTLFPPKAVDPVSSNILNIAINIVSGIILYLILKVLQNTKRLGLFLRTQFLLFNKDIRLSFSYLIRIKVDDQYLLVKSRTRNYYQFVGGAYKTLPGSEYIFNKLGVKPDRVIETEQGIAKGDLRLFVKGTNVIDLINWFDSKKDRETSPWREFCEELITPGILPWNEFRYIDYKYVGTVQTSVMRLPTGDLGMYVHEIFDLIYNREQEVLLRQLLANGNSDAFIWTNEYLINRGGHDERTKQTLFAIGDHTKWAIAI